MRKFITRLVSFVLLLTSLATLTVYGGYSSIERRYEGQEKSNWCWVANSRNLVIAERPTNRRPTRTQSDAVKYIKGSIMNVQGFLNNVVDAAEYISEGDYGYKMTSPLKFTTLFNLVDSLNSPAYFSLQNKKDNYGHGIMMYGADNAKKKVLIYDPASGGGNRWVYYDDLVDGTWSYYKGYVYDDTVYCTAHY